MRRSAQQATGQNKYLMFRTKEEASMEELCSAIGTANDIWEASEAMVVIHAGTTETLLGAVTPANSASMLTSKLTSWLGRAPNDCFVIYALADEGSGSKTQQDRCREWNTLLQGVCKEMGPRVELVRTNWAMADGKATHPYSGRTAEKLGRRLGCRLCFFRPKPRCANHKSETSPDPPLGCWGYDDGAQPNIEILGCMERDISELDMPVVILEGLQCSH